jgi:uncharacterized protein YndB with AHSA1/START domain
MRNSYLATEWLHYTLTLLATAKLQVMDELPQIERTVDLPARPDEVWEKIVDGDLAQGWLGVRLDPRPGGDVTVPDREMIGTVEEVTPGESVTWSWREVDGEPSQVTIEISPIDDGTRISITERLLEYRITGSPPIFLARAA